MHLHQSIATFIYPFTCIYMAILVYVLTIGFSLLTSIVVHHFLKKIIKRLTHPLREAFGSFLTIHSMYYCMRVASSALLSCQFEWKLPTVIIFGLFSLYSGVNLLFLWWSELALADKSNCDSCHHCGRFALTVQLCVSTTSLDGTC